MTEDKYDAETDVYNSNAAENLRESDEISPEEEGFLKGYEEDTPEETDDDEEKDYFADEE